MSVSTELHSAAAAPGNESPLVDLAANRAAVKYSTAEQLRRILWALGRWAMVLSPRPFFMWRRVLLRAFGAKVGRHVCVYPSARIYMPWNLELGDWSAIGEYAFVYNLGPVRIGEQATVSYRSHICAGTHDFADSKVPLLKMPVTIGARAWIGTDAFVGPGVTVGEGALVGARAVVVNDVEPMQIVAGNPARPIGMRTGGMRPGGIRPVAMHESRNSGTSAC